jgi:hypothetical protein
MKTIIDQFREASLYGLIAEIIQAAIIAALFFGPLFYWMWEHP